MTSFRYISLPFIRQEILYFGWIEFFSESVEMNLPAKWSKREHNLEVTHLIFNLADSYPHGKIISIRDIEKIYLMIDKKIRYRLLKCMKFHLHELIYMNGTLI
ncbi:unnamed protein product [Brugia timori]|uniref:Uncharacterized protein n=1 Tax=Brugia timori TaxID=42155 RepID=A0A0R3QL93_9BILA|nr:unnamed protein product [Brugia timori]